MARFDLADEQWEKLSPLLPPQRTGRPGHPYRDHRMVLNGILWQERTGAPWRDLPEGYGPWRTCYSRLRRWQRRGLWLAIWQQLQATEFATRDGSPVEWYACAIDSTTVKAHPHAAGAPHTPHPRKRGKFRRTSRTSLSRMSLNRMSPKNPATMRSDAAAEG